MYKQRNLRRVSGSHDTQHKQICSRSDYLYDSYSRKRKKLTPHYRFHLITSDQDNNKFVDCAITANAEYIVTEDHHFNELKNISFPSVAIINLKDFAKTL